jgi:AraC-like DNA-binding protein
VLHAPRLILTPGAVLYLGPGVSTTEHRHYAIQISIGFDSPISASVDGRWITGRSVLFPSECPHRFESSGATAILLLEPQSAAGRALATSRASSVTTDWLPAELLAGPSADDDAVPWLERVLVELAGVAPAAPAPSAVVLAALEYIERSLHGVPRLADAARAASISPSRLTHLFTEEVGIPFRRYVLWARLRVAAEASRGGANLTEAAVEAGFADSAHLTRVFKRTFGMTPSSVLGEFEVVGSS